MKEITSLLLLKMKVYFYSYFNVCFLFCFLFFSFGLIKLIMTTAVIISLFFTFGMLLLSFLASSICLCHNASFISNLHNKKKFKGENA